jgi:ribA/ribD-fused uncharacterized protein
MAYGRDSYATPEHFFQAMKTTDPQERTHIASQKTPGDAKRAGRKANLRIDWEDIKRGVMEYVQHYRLSKEPKMLDKLITTEGDIVEWTTWHDREWGKCICPRCNGKGKNILGSILMELREELKEQTNVSEHG